MIGELCEILDTSDSSDLYAIRKYIAWVQFRRQMHDVFYTKAHWVQRSVWKKSSGAFGAHWI